MDPFKQFATDRLFKTRKIVETLRMEVFNIIAVLIVLSACFGYVNVRILKLPNTIGLMIIAIAFTMVIFASTLVTDRVLNWAKFLINEVDFELVLLDIMLGFLLFAGALHTNFDQLRVQRWPVIVFATIGVLTSTLLVAVLSWFSFEWLGLEVKFIHCLLFGALISPTDPIAVLGILKKTGVPKKLETKIVGESLFNDGVGVVVFLSIMTVATGMQGHGPQTSLAPIVRDADGSVRIAHDDLHDATANAEAHKQGTDPGHLPGDPSFFGVLKLFAVEVFGGIVFGAVIGYATFLLLRSIDDYEIEVMITLACVMGGYAIAHAWGLSAPLAIVVAGLIVGNDTVRGTAMSDLTEQYVDKFWELLDILMNAILFVLIGLEILVLTFEQKFVMAAGLSIVIVLFSRYVSLLIPVTFFRKKLQFVPHTTTIMTWGGLRGGISIALALSLPASMNRELFLTVTYGVVVFSIIAQGLTVGKLATRLLGKEAMEPSTGH